MLMRDEKGRKKQARSYKQDKATQHTQCSYFSKGKMSCLGWDVHVALYSTCLLWRYQSMHRICSTNNPPYKQGQTNNTRATIPMVCHCIGWLFLLPMRLIWAGRFQCYHRTFHCETAPTYTPPHACSTCMHSHSLTHTHTHTLSHTHTHTYTHTHTHSHTHTHTHTHTHSHTHTLTHTHSLTHTHTHTLTHTHTHTHTHIPACFKER